MTAERTTRLTISVLEGVQEGQSFSLGSTGSFLIGRAADCDVTLPADDGSASRYHCMIDFAPPEIRIRDLGSKNGIVVNGSSYAGKRPDETREQSKARQTICALHSGDRITVGDTVLKVELAFKETQTTSHDDTVALPAEAKANDDYETLSVLGRGGMGVVYRAKRKSDGREVALKLLTAPARDAHAHALFDREIAILKQVQHDSIVDLLDHGLINHRQSGTTPFVALELMEGGSLEELVTQNGPLTISEALALTKQAAKGLAFAHQKGIVHRDVKPANLLLSHPFRSPTSRVKVADLGLAKSYADAGLSGFTSTGTACGTPHYMARAQLADYKRCGPAVDAFGLAGTLFFLLTGSPPRQIERGEFPAIAVLTRSPRRLHEALPNAPPHLCEVVDAALAESLAFPDAESFAQALGDTP